MNLSHKLTVTQLVNQITLSIEKQHSIFPRYAIREQKNLFLPTLI